MLLDQPPTAALKPCSARVGMARACGVAVRHPLLALRYFNVAG